MASVLLIESVKLQKIVVVDHVALIELIHADNLVIRKGREDGAAAVAAQILSPGEIRLILFSRLRDKAEARAAERAEDQTRT